MNNRFLIFSLLFVSIQINLFGQSEKVKPNIIMVMTDDQGWFDAGFNGNDVIKTPNLDALASEGVILDRFYSASAVCSPTRASVITGRNPFRVGIPFANNGHLKEEEITLPEILKDKAGYTTAHFGKWHLGTLTKTVKDGNRGGTAKGEQEYTIPTMHGYDSYFATESKVPTYDPMVYPAKFEKGESRAHGWKARENGEATKPYGTAYWVSENGVVKDNIDGCDSKVILDRVIPFMENAVKENTPFFTTVWFHTPHKPLVTDEKQRNQYKHLSLKEQLYYGSITAMDTQMGRLWEKLKELNIDENTIILFCSDNGPTALKNSSGPFRGKKRSLYEGGVRVPAFVLWKNHFKGQDLIDVPMVTSDYLPTILDILDIEYPSNRPIDGESVLKILEGKQKERKNPIGFLILDEATWVNGQYKLYMDEDGEIVELYDLIKDKSEKNNLHKTHPEIVKTMKEEFYEWKKSVDKSINGGDYSMVESKKTVKPVKSTKLKKSKKSKKRKKSKKAAKSKKAVISNKTAETVKTVEPTKPVKADDGRPEKPNVLFILTDDLGWQDVKCYDIDEPSPFETPNIDKLAKGGVLFWQAYSPATTCSPSRGAILSGKHPVRLQRTAVRGGHPPMPYNHSSPFISPWQKGALDASEVTIAEALQLNGYKTGHSGKWHVGVAGTDIPLPTQQGFDFSKHGFGSHRRMKDRTTGFATTDASDKFRLDEDGFPFDDITQDGIDFMSENKNDPFFLFYCSRLVHTPIHTRSEALLQKYYKKLGIDYPKEKDVWKETGQKNAYYAAMIETIDHYTGLLIKYLEETEDPRWPGHMLIENTYVIFTSDNGGMEQHTGEVITDNYPLDKGKINAKEGGVRVPLIITGPNISPNQESNVMVNGVDFYPTILSWTNTKKQENQIFDGADLSTLLDENPDDSKLIIDPWTGEERNSMMWHFPNSKMQSTLRIGDYKLVRYYVTNEAKTSLELYQLYENGSKRVDIEEAKNLATKMPEKTKEMDLLLQQRLEKLNARFPLLNPAAKSSLPNKSKVPTVVNHGVDGKKVWLTYKNNGAKVVKAELIYTTDGGTRGEVWVPIEMELSNGKVSVTLPEGTTHYVFNLVDENNFLIGYPEAGFLKETKIFSTKAIAVE